MMRSITLVDFQSHQRTHLALGPLTVIVGSSSSGKSAVVRAIRLVAQNARGTTYVRQGQKQTRVSLELGGPDDQPTVVSIARGKGVSEYELALPGAAEPTVFTKCSTSTPESLTDLMGLGDPSLWLAGQFDRPFLLDETGSAVAQVLGRLTNVTMIYAAVRECNRRAAEIKRRYNDQSSELTQVRDDLRAYVSLPARLEAGRRAESAVERATQLSDRRVRLASRVREADDATDRLGLARSGLRSVPEVGHLGEVSVRRARLADRLREVAAAASRRSTVKAALRQVPDTVIVESLVTRRATLGGALRSLTESEGRQRRLSEESSEASAAVAAARDQFTEALSRAGSCPLCGASAAHAQIDNVV